MLGGEKTENTWKTICVSVKHCKSQWSIFEDQLNLVGVPKKDGSNNSVPFSNAGGQASRTHMGPP